MRASFDTTMSVYPSVGGVPSPDPSHVGVPCRFVPQRHVFPQETPLAVRVGWVTYAAVELSGPVSAALGPQALVEYGSVSWLLIDLLSAGPLIVLLTEAISDIMPGPYTRASVGEPWWFLPMSSRPAWAGPFWPGDKELSAMREVAGDAPVP